MNIDRKLVARAFAKAGEEAITDAEWEEGTSGRVRVTKDFYHAVILEALSSYDWTSQKKRAALEAIDPEDEENLTVYDFMYALPADCARCISVNDGAEYQVEGGFLYTNDAEAILLYITNYFTGQYVYEEVAESSEEDFDKYYVLIDGDYVKATGSYDSTVTYYIRVDEDYPFYAEPVFDAHLSAYIECKLAADVALKLTGDKEKYSMLFNEANIIGNQAQKKSAEMARNKSRGNVTWVEQLGLGDVMAPTRRR